MEYLDASQSCVFGRQSRLHTKIAVKSKLDCQAWNLNAKSAIDSKGVNHAYRYQHTGHSRSCVRTAAERPRRPVAAEDMPA